jgi:hypothetical protein
VGAARGSGSVISLSRRRRESAYCRPSKLRSPPREVRVSISDIAPCKVGPSQAVTAWRPALTAES